MPDAPARSTTSSKIVWSVAAVLLIVASYLTGTILFVALLAPLVPVVIGLVRKARGTEKPAPVRRDRDTAAAIMAGVAAALWIFAGTYLMAWKLMDNDEPFRRIELVGGISFGLMYALPGVLILLGFRRRALLQPAVACGFILSFMAFTLAPVFLVLTLLTLWSYVRTQPERWDRAGVAAVLAVLLLAGSWAAHLSGNDPLCYSFTRDADGRITYTVSKPSGGSSGEFQSSLGPGGPGSSSGSECTSDITTSTEGAVSIIFIALIPFAAWIAAGPSPSSRREGDGHFVLEQ